MNIYRLYPYVALILILISVLTVSAFDLSANVVTEPLQVNGRPVLRFTKFQTNGNDFKLRFTLEGDANGFVTRIEPPSKDYNNIARTTLLEFGSPKFLPFNPTHHPQSCSLIPCSTSTCETHNFDPIEGVSTFIETTTFPAPGNTNSYPTYRIHWSWIHPAARVKSSTGAFNGHTNYTVAWTASNPFAPLVLGQYFELQCNSLFDAQALTQSTDLLKGFFVRPYSTAFVEDSSNYMIDTESWGKQPDLSFPRGTYGAHLNSNAVTFTLIDVMSTHMMLTQPISAQNTILDVSPSTLRSFYSEVTTTDSQPSYFNGKQLAFNSTYKHFPNTQERPIYPEVMALREGAIIVEENANHLFVVGSKSNFGNIFASSKIKTYKLTCTDENGQDHNLSQQQPHATSNGNVFVVSGNQFWNNNKLLATTCAFFLDVETYDGAIIRYPTDYSFALWHQPEFFSDFNGAVLGSPRLPILFAREVQTGVGLPTVKQLLPLCDNYDPDSLKCYDFKSRAYDTPAFGSLQHCRELWDNTANGRPITGFGGFQFKFIADSYPAVYRPVSEMLQTERCVFVGFSKFNPMKSENTIKDCQGTETSGPTGCNAMNQAIQRHNTHPFNYIRQDLIEVNPFTRQFTEENSVRLPIRVYLTGLLDKRLDETALQDRFYNAITVHLYKYQPNVAISTLISNEQNRLAGVVLDLNRKLSRSTNENYGHQFNFWKSPFIEWQVDISLNVAQLYQQLSDLIDDTGDVLIRFEYMEVILEHNIILKNLCRKGQVLTKGNNNQLQCTPHCPIERRLQANPTWTPSSSVKDACMCAYQDSDGIFETVQTTQQIFSCGPCPCGKDPNTGQCNSFNTAIGLCGCPSGFTGLQCDLPFNCPVVCDPQKNLIHGSRVRAGKCPSADNCQCKMGYDNPEKEDSSIIKCGCKKEDDGYSFFKTHHQTVVNIASDETSYEYKPDAYTQTQEQYQCHINNTHPISYTAKLCSIPVNSPFVINKANDNLIDIPRPCHCKLGFAGQYCQYPSVLVEYKLMNFMQQTPETPLGSLTKEQIAAISDIVIIDFVYKGLNATLYKLDYTKNVLIYEVWEEKRTTTPPTPFVVQNNNPTQNHDDIHHNPRFTPKIRALLMASAVITTQQQTQDKSLFDLWRELQDLKVPTLDDGKQNDNTQRDQAKPGQAYDPQCNSGLYPSGQVPIWCSGSGNQGIAPVTPGTAADNTYDQDIESEDQQTRQWPLGKSTGSQGFKPEDTTKVIAIAIAIPVGVIIFLIVIVVSVKYCKRHEKACFAKPKAKASKKQQAANLTKLDTTEMSYTCHNTPSGSASVTPMSVTGGTKQQNSLSPTIMPSVAEQPKDSRPLPKGWQHQVDPSTGKTFYLNINTMTSSWVHPEDMGRGGANDNGW